jgi:hypothetical protein
MRTSIDFETGNIFLCETIYRGSFFDTIQSWAGERTLRLKEL